MLTFYIYQDERDKILLELKELQAENKALVSEMQLYKDNDPETYKAKGKKKMAPALPFMAMTILSLCRESHCCVQGGCK